MLGTGVIAFLAAAAEIIAAVSQSPPQEDHLPQLDAVSVKTPVSVGTEKSRAVCATAKKKTVGHRLFLA